MTRARIGALAALDAAIELVRSEPPARLLLSAAPALGITWLLLFLYYLERVEGVRTLRPWFALGLVLLWGARGLLLGRFAGRCVERRLADDGGGATHGPAENLLAGALFAGAELWLWLWLLIAAVHVDAWLALAALPVLSLRGALAPSWLAACDAQRELHPGAVALGALRAADKQRLVGIGAELLILLGSAGLFFNFGALLAAGISLSQDLLGLELSFVRAFISPSNHFALLGVAGLALSAFEPLRAALSGVLFAEHRHAHEGIGVRALVRRCLERGAAATLLLGLLLFLAPVRAQAEVAGGLAGDECDETCSEARARDDVLLVELVSILDGDEFREFPDERWGVDRLGEDALSRWVEGFWRWLRGEQGEAPAPRGQPLPAVPSARVALALGIALLGTSVLVWLGSLLRKRRGTAAARGHDAAETALLSPDQSPGLALAPAEIDPRRALRALYLASLSGLARRGLLTLSLERTNGHYLAKLPDGPDRARFAELTSLFDRSHYGALTPSSAELAHSERLAQALVHGTEAG